MPLHELVDLWPMIEGCIRACWRLAEPHIEAEARDSGVPVELYYYGELGLDTFSVAEFQKRAPYSNPARPARWPQRS